MIKQYINVDENDSSYYIADSSYSYYIGFVYDEAKDDQYGSNNFGYIITNNKRFGLSYSELVGHLNQTTKNCYYYVDNYPTPYYTNELILCANNGHEANLNEIRANQATLKTYFINSVTIKLRPDIKTNQNGYATPAYMIIRDRGVSGNNDSIDATDLKNCPRSINSIVQSDYANKYVTFYFDHVFINHEYTETPNATARYGFRLIDADGHTIIMQCHVNPTNIQQDVICMANGGGQRTWQPAFGVNVAHMFNEDGLIESFNNHISINWNSNPLYMRNFTTSGNYIIKGTHTNSADDFPITSTGFNFIGNLQVLSSSFTGDTTTYTITQILNLNTTEPNSSSYIFIRKGWAPTISDLKNGTQQALWNKKWNVIQTTQFG